MGRGFARSLGLGVSGSLGLWVSGSLGLWVSGTLNGDTLNGAKVSPISSDGRAL